MFGVSPQHRLRAASSSPSIAWSRPRSANLRAAPVGACAAAAKPSQRQIVAFARHQPLAGLEQCRKLRPGGAIDDADLRQTAGELRRRLNILRQRRDAVGELWIGWIDGRAGPMHWRRVHRAAHRDRRRARRPAPSRNHCRRPASRSTGGQRFLLSTANSLPMVLASVSSRCTPRSAVASGSRVASISARAWVCATSAPRAAASASASAACAVASAAPSVARSGSPLPVAIRPASILASSACEPRGALLVIGKRGLQLIAPRRQIRQRAGQLGKGFFGRRKRRVCRRRRGY